MKMCQLLSGMANISIKNSIATKKQNSSSMGGIVNRLDSNLEPECNGY